MGTERARFSQTKRRRFRASGEARIFRSASADEIRPSVAKETRIWRIRQSAPKFQAAWCEAVGLGRSLRKSRAAGAPLRRSAPSRSRTLEFCFETRTPQWPAAGRAISREVRVGTWRVRPRKQDITPETIRSVEQALRLRQSWSREAQARRKTSTVERASEIQVRRFFPAERPELA